MPGSRSGSVITSLQLMIVNAPPVYEIANRLITITELNTLVKIVNQVNNYISRSALDGKVVVLLVEKVE